MKSPEGARQLEAHTEAGARFVEIAESHVERFRSRAHEHDMRASFPGENFDELKQSGAIAAFVPKELGGLGLESVHDWALGLERLGRADPSTGLGRWTSAVAVPSCRDTSSRGSTAMCEPDLSCSPFLRRKRRSTSGRWDSGCIPKVEPPHVLIPGESCRCPTMAETCALRRRGTRIRQRR